ncbi:Hypothetical predicted protein [Marmota monax]|uniref:Immunoglobulin V-set domain-containing protein n=1 Tax=Marmota monax TaxID=9995 RepID=A0A5E4CAB2_MARMO|nr:Hypothetical predicted protein [Marmota monax]
MDYISGSFCVSSAHFTIQSPFHQYDDIDATRCRVNSQQEEESPRVLSVQEGENATMNCSYKSSTTTLQWYRQDSASQAADAATYFCATDAQRSAGTCSPDANPARAAS